MRPDFEQNLKNPVAATVTLYYELMRTEGRTVRLILIRVAILIVVWSHKFKLDSWPRIFIFRK